MPASSAGLQANHLAKLDSIFMRIGMDATYEFGAATREEMLIAFDGEEDAVDAICAAEAPVGAQPMTLPLCTDPCICVCVDSHTHCANGEDSWPPSTRPKRSEEINT